MSDTCKEEVLFEVNGGSGFNNMILPVKLLNFSNGTFFQLHLQTGDFHQNAVALANTMLAERGLFIGNPLLIAPSGVYYEVVILPKKPSIETLLDTVLKYCDVFDPGHQLVITNRDLGDEQPDPMEIN